jgi:hypothetical protein
VQLHEQEAAMAFTITDEEHEHLTTIEKQIAALDDERAVLAAERRRILERGRIRSKRSGNGSPDMTWPNIALNFDVAAKRFAQVVRAIERNGSEG